MPAVPVRSAATAGTLALALALAAPLAAFADPTSPQGQPGNPGEQRSATATATIGGTPPAQGEGPGAGTQNSQGVGDEDADQRKVTLCHATGSQTNPFVVITVSKAAVLNGHADHQDREDIIPSFTYTDGSGQTRTFAAQGDQSILAAQCATPVSGQTGAPVKAGEQPAQAPVTTTGGSTQSPAQAPVTTTGGSTQSPAQAPVTTTGGVAVTAPAAAAVPLAVSGVTQAPAVAAVPASAPVPAPAPAPGAPAATAGQGTVTAQGVAGTVLGAGTVGTTVRARAAATPAALPFTGISDLSVLLALGVGALGLGGFANRVGGRELRAKHVLR